MSTPQRQFVIENYLGGIHEEVDASLLKANEASKAQNCNIDKGVLQSTNGLTAAYGATLTTPQAIMSYYQNSTNKLVMVGGGGLYIYNTGTSSFETQGSVPNSISTKYDYINNNVDDKDVLVFTNGTDPVMIFDGTGVRNLKKLGKSSTAGIDNTITGKYLVMHYERLWIASDNSVYASSATRDGFDIEDFTTPTDETEVNMHGFEIPMYGSDGIIVGMAVVFDDVVIFKEKSIHKIFGSDPSNYNKINFSAKGGISDKSIAVHESGAYFIDHSGIMYYDGTNVSYISKNIEDTWKLLDVTKLNKAVGFIHDDKYCVAVCEGSSGVNNLIIEYDIANKNFMFRRGFIVNGYTEFNRKVLIINGTTTIYQYDKGATYPIAGTNTTGYITSYWESGYTDLGIPEATKEMESLYVTASGNGSIKIIVTTELGAKETTLNLTSTDKVYPVNFIHRGRMFKVRIENVNGSVFVVKAFKILYELDID